MFFVNCFVHNLTEAYIKKEYKDNSTGFVANILAPWLLLLGAWIFKTVFV